MWPDDAFSLPARDGYDVGGAQERAMSARVDGYGGIRETYEVNPDGSVTTLRTRLGWPAFETTGQQTAAAPTVPARGFVAKVPGGRAVLFNPYTLAVLKSPYLPASNSYSVQDFGTTWNVAPSDTTHWYDVVLFDGTTIKVNSKAMPSLRITANHGFPAIPYAINRDTADDQYGNAERNATEKRVFAVGRYSVKSWGGSGVVETLSPTTPRTDDKAMTVGQRIEESTDTARIGQIYFTGDTWDSDISEWYVSWSAILMQLTSGYLSSTENSICAAISVKTMEIRSGGASGSITENFSLPSVELFPVGIASISTNPYINAVVYWTWQEGFFAALLGESVVDYSDTVANSDLSGYPSVYDMEQNGRTLTITEFNTKTFSSRSKNIYVPGQYVSVPCDGTHDVLRETLNLNSGLYEWNAPPPSAPGNRGSADPYLYGDNVLHDEYEGTFAEYDYDTQSGGFSIELEDGNVLMSCSFSNTRYAGNDFDVHPVVGQFSFWYANPSTDTSSYSLIVENNSTMTTPEAIAGWPTLIAYANSWIGTKDYRRASVVFSDITSSEYIKYYTSSIVDIDVSEKSLSWSTKDYLLYDATNGVYVSIEGDLSGSNTTALLTVIVRVKTRHNETTQIVGTWSFSYSDMLPEREIGGSGRLAIPSPQLRAIFAPMYQEQGSFKGAHYVTLAEESNGATPFHGFNFLLYLRPYSSLNTCNADNETGQLVYFVPCNLLEMLYAFVFSSEYGVALSGERYPVTHSANFTYLMSSLFSNPIRVSVRNGTVGGWTDALGSDFASVSTVSLHRA